MKKHLVLGCLVGLVGLLPAPAAVAQFNTPTVTGNTFGFDGSRTSGPERPRIYLADANGNVDRAHQPPGYPKPGTDNYKLRPNEVAQFHNAIDISSGGRQAEFNAGVYGTVVSSGVGRIDVRTANGDLIRYLHNSAAYLKAGDLVTPTTPLGLTGNVNTSQIHLHVQATNAQNLLINPDTAILGGRNTPLGTPLAPQLSPRVDFGNVIQGLKPVVRDGELKLTDSTRLYYDDNAPKVLGGGRVGAAPKAANTGNYATVSQAEAKVIPTNIPRAQRLQQNLQQQKALWGGIVMGNVPKKSPMVREAKWKTDGHDASLLIKVDGSEAYASFAATNPTELWAAYHFLRPNDSIKALGANPSDVGLVSATKHLDRGEADFVIHPAIANTSIAREAMRLDLVLGLQDPSFPVLPQGWRFLQWYDEPAEIKVKDNCVVVEPSSNPKTTLLRVRLFLEKQHQEIDGATLDHVYQKVDAMRTVDRFARTLAVLTWLDLAGKLPALPDKVQPEKLNVPSQWNQADVLLGTATQIHGWLPNEDRSRSHDVFLEKGKKYRIDLESYFFDTILTLQDSNGRKLAEDDDGGINTNSRLEFAPTSTGNYRLVVSPFEGKGAGSYRLTAKALADSWVDKSIFPTQAGLRIGHADDRGQYVYVATLQAMEYRVTSEQGIWINVAAASGSDGWFKKTDAILAEDALDFFTDRVNRNPKDSHAVESRLWILKQQQR